MHECTPTSEMEPVVLSNSISLYDSQQAKMRLRTCRGKDDLTDIVDGPV